MATYRGQDGSVSWNSSVVAECRSWVLNSSQLDTIEDTVKGDTSKTFKTGLLDPGTASVTVYLDYAGAGQGAIIDDIIAGTGTAATLLLIVDTGKEFSVSGIPVGFNSASPEGSSIVEATIEFRLSGAISVNWA